LSEWYQKGMSLTGPIPKDLVEYFENHSFFFRDQLERDNSPARRGAVVGEDAPAGPIKKLAGVTPNLIDKKTGKKVSAGRARPTTSSSRSRAPRTTCSSS
jgi:hypothetical protein